MPSFIVVVEQHKRVSYRVEASSSDEAHELVLEGCGGKVASINHPSQVVSVEEIKSERFPCSHKPVKLKMRGPQTRKTNVLGSK